MWIEQKKKKTVKITTPWLRFAHLEFKICGYVIVMSTVNSWWANTPFSRSTVLKSELHINTVVV
jgi:hypothetical protein